MSNDRVLHLNSGGRSTMSGGETADPVLLVQMVEMGFDPAASERALELCHNDVARAIDRVMSGVVTAPKEEVKATAPVVTAPPVLPAVAAVNPREVERSKREEEREAFRKRQLAKEEEEAKREREAAARQRAILHEQVQRDKAERAAKALAAAATTTTTTGSGTGTVSGSVASPPAEQGNHVAVETAPPIQEAPASTVPPLSASSETDSTTPTMCEIKLMCPGGIRTVVQFPSNTLYSELVEHVSKHILHGSRQFQFVRNHPPLPLNESQKDVTLKELGIVARDLLVVQPNQDRGVVKEYTPPPPPIARDEDEGDSDHTPSPPPAYIARRPRRRYIRARDPDVDNMSYEQLVELGETVGKVSCGLPREAIEGLPTKTFQAGDKGGEGEKCVICCEEFEDGEEVRVLPCLHSFHTECVAKWLADHHRCPICNQDAFP
ncbi:zinc finger protein [Pelomyxa schiedti]|nr:zinc finger protein [Pelomyxa schiedti]